MNKLSKEIWDKQMKFREEVIQSCKAILKSRALINKADDDREWSIYGDGFQVVRERHLLALDRELAELNKLLFSEQDVQRPRGYDDSIPHATCDCQEITKHHELHHEEAGYGN